MTAEHVADPVAVRNPRTPCDIAVRVRDITP